MPKINKDLINKAFDENWKAMSVYQDLHRSKYESVLKELKESFDKKQNFKDHILEYVQFNNDFSQPYAGVSNFNKTLQQLETANLDVQSGMKSAIERIDGTYQEFLDPFIQLPRLDVEVNALIAQINTHKHLFEGSLQYWGKDYMENPACNEVIEKLAEHFCKSPDSLKQLVFNIDMAGPLTFLLTEHRILAIVGVPLFLTSVVTLYNPSEFPRVVTSAYAKAVSKTHKAITLIKVPELPVVVEEGVTAKLLNLMKKTYSKNIGPKIPTALGGTGSLANNGAVTWNTRVRQGGVLVALSAAGYAGYTQGFNNIFASLLSRPQGGYVDYVIQTATVALTKFRTGLITRPRER